MKFIPVPDKKDKIFEAKDFHDIVIKDLLRTLIIK